MRESVRVLKKATAPCSKPWRPPGNQNCLHHLRLHPRTGISRACGAGRVQRDHPARGVPRPPGGNRPAAGVRSGGGLFGGVANRAIRDRRSQDRKSHNRGCAWAQIRRQTQRCLHLNDVARAQVGIRKCPVTAEITRPVRDFSTFFVDTSIGFGYWPPANCTVSECQNRWLGVPTPCAVVVPPCLRTAGTVNEPSTVAGRGIGRGEKERQWCLRLPSARGGEWRRDGSCARPWRGVESPCGRRAQ